MQAKNCLLTHFSARYPKLPPLTVAPVAPLAMTTSDTIKGPIEPVVAIAFDMATLSLDEFWKMQKYGEAMRGLFRDDEVEGDDASI